MKNDRFLDKTLYCLIYLPAVSVKITPIEDEAKNRSRWVHNDAYPSAISNSFKFLTLIYNTGVHRGNM